MELPKEKWFVRIFKKERKIPKKRYKPLDKRSLFILPSKIASDVKIDGSNLWIRIRSSSLRNRVKSADTILVIEELPEPDGPENPATSVRGINLAKGAVPVEIFKLALEDGKLQLWLNYSANAEEIGEPFRDDFFLTFLEPKKPVRILINGYRQRAGKGHMERIYTEMVYILEAMGGIVVREKSNKIFSSAIVPPGETSINLRRLFY
jgi:hypothetical protein